MHFHSRSRKERIMEKEFEKVKEALEDFGKKVVTAVKKGKGEADKATRVAQLRIEIGSLNRQMGDLFRDLGELFYKNYNKASKAGQEELVETVTHIAAVEKSIASLKREIKSVKGGKALPPKTRGRKPAGGAVRGRPKKTGTAAKAPAKRRGRTPKAQAGTSTEAPKRRGRPPKAKTE